MQDLRSDAEKRYDAERDGTLYTAQPERSPLFYELKAWIDSHFDGDTLTDQEKLVLQLITMRQPTEPADTPLLTFEDGSTISGTYEDDGERACVHLQAQDGQFYAAFDGSISGDWGDHYFEELTIAQIEKLRELFSSPLLPALIDAAKAWCKE